MSVSVDEYRAAVAKGMHEEALQNAVIEQAKDLGWRVVHFRPARSNKGWRTAVQGHGEGFPDVIALRDDVQLVAEIKTMTGRLDDDQKLWLAAFKAAGAQVYVWRPIHLLSGEIADVLSQRTNEVP